MSLSERIQRNVDATAWPGEIPMNYIYTAGRAQDAFFKALRDEGKFTGTRCENCDIVLCPPQMFCERCFSNIEKATVDLPNRGYVYTFTVSHETYDEQAKDEPSLVAMIQIEGTDGALYHRLGEVDPADVMIGMPVEAVFKPKNERAGSILDIKYFKPAG